LDHYYALIMAGGGGTRLWPLSTEEKPKQLLPLVEDQSMFKVSVERLAPMFPPDRIYVVTGQKYVADLRADAPEIPARNFIVEPYGKESGPAAMLGLMIIQQYDPQATVAILTADHHITDKEGFRSVLATAYDLAQNGHIVTLGIKPSFGSTGFGYIRLGKEPLGSVNDQTYYRSRGFTEKPNAAIAKAFYESGEYSWNSGMFIWKADVAKQELQRQQPEMYACLSKIAATVDTAAYAGTLERLWENIEKISLDFAVMDGAQNMVIIPVSIGWNDVGDWASLYDVLPRDEAGNCVKSQQPNGGPYFVKSKNTLVYSDDGKPIVAIGVEDMVIVDTAVALLVCHRERTQDIKEVVTRLRAAGNSSDL
jgi:mannose-1-phosphate guanylyltransferase